MVEKLPLIAIIDDDMIYQFMLSRIINDNKLAENIISFSEGEQAFQYLSENKINSENIPDVIFLDVNMPIMDGWMFIEAFAHLKTQIQKKIVIFMLSSSIDPVDIEKAYKISEISSYFIKPIKLKEVKRIFKDYKTFL
ncbi:response regulator [Polaribacter irgensii 23-P]|uniref:Response regulator n=1 Tax=Polaribacter irgensii 23-P TaxID=313594 RepID=A4C0H7_9FLAO|nr:response regulator [Polaribacter irgensii]EAR12920.1 response regulator [Polaribacter irgensii 23-P]